MVNLIMNTIIFSHLTGECPNVTVCYKQKMTFSHEILLNLSENWHYLTSFRTPKSSKTFGIHQLNS